jgi:hypothetical protein
MDKHRVLYVVESRIVLRSMLPAMLATRQLGVDVDVYVFDFGPNHAYYLLFEDAATYLKSLGFTVFRKTPQNMRYNVVYSAYPGDYENINALNRNDYYVMFNYGHGVSNLSSVNLMSFVYYDFILCFGEPDVSIQSCHTKTYPIGNIKLWDYTRSRVAPSGKKTILYLPTWAEQSRPSSLKMGAAEELLKLKGTYNIVTKAHNATAHFTSHQHYLKHFCGFDNVYDVNTPIGDMLNDADVVLSDVSSAAFDALAGDVPLALFGIEGNPLYGAEPLLHNRLVNDGIVPHSENLDDLEAIIEQALTPECFAKQQAVKKDIFPFSGQECIDAFIDFQDRLLNGSVDPRYIATRRAIRHHYIRRLGVLYNNGLEDMKQNMLKWHEDELTSFRLAYEASSSWKMTAPFRAASKFIKSILPAVTD